MCPRIKLQLKRTIDGKDSGYAEVVNRKVNRARKSIAVKLEIVLLDGRQSSERTRIPNRFQRTGNGLRQFKLEPEQFKRTIQRGGQQIVLVPQFEGQRMFGRIDFQPRQQQLIDRSGGDKVGNRIPGHRRGDFEIKSDVDRS